MLDPIVIATIVLLALLLLRVHVFVTILAASLVYFILTPAVPAMIAGQRIASGVESIPLLAIPFFVAAGIFMNYTGIARRVMDFAEALTGWPVSTTSPGLAAGSSTGLESSSIEGREGQDPPAVVGPGAVRLVTGQSSVSTAE